MKNCQVKVLLFNMTLQIVYKVDMFSTNVALVHESPSDS
jgi:hypothetical protein